MQSTRLARAPPGTVAVRTQREHQLFGGFLDQLGGQMFHEAKSGIRTLWSRGSREYPNPASGEIQWHPSAGQMRPDDELARAGRARAPDRPVMPETPFAHR